MQYCGQSHHRREPAWLSPAMDPREMPSNEQLRTWDCNRGRSSWGPYRVKPWRDCCSARTCWCSIRPTRVCRTSCWRLSPRDAGARYARRRHAGSRRARRERLARSLPGTKPNSAGPSTCYSRIRHCGNGCAREGGVGSRSASAGIRSSRKLWPCLKVTRNESPDAWRRRGGAGRPAQRAGAAAPGVCTPAGRDTST